MCDILKKCKIGVALSGGGAKGIAHLGALKAFEEHGLHIDVLSGVSAGAIIAALYADGHTTDEICKFIKDNNIYSSVSPTMPKKGGFTNMNAFKHRLGQILKAKTFDQLHYPIFINATELNSGQNVYFSEGKLLDCIIASASVPIIFTPTVINGKSYVDGGFFCNMPASILRQNGCDFVIGIHVNPTTHISKIGGIKEISERIFHLAINGNTIEQKKQCNLVIEIEKAKKYKMFDFSKCDEIYALGHEAATSALKKFDWDAYATEWKILNSYKKIN